jgi:predicted dehydrogenase
MTELPERLDYLPRLPRNKSAGIGCIGAGSIMDECHLVAYRSAGFEPIAIASRTRQRAVDVAARHGIASVYDEYRSLLADPRVEVVDIAVPPDIQIDVVRESVRHADHVRGILAQKPLGVSFKQAREIVALCQSAGITLAVNQNMRYDQSIRACRDLLVRGWLGTPVFATIDMRAIPHWMPWQQRQGWVTLRIMSIHHLDAFRFLFGNPARVFASVRPDPRTTRKFPHEDGICLYILEYENGLRAAAWDDVWAGPSAEGAASDIGIRWRVEGTEGLARGTIGWPDYPKRTPSTLEWTSVHHPGQWLRPTWPEAWFPDAFVGPMAELLCALEDGKPPNLSGEDNLHTMALVEACYRSVRERRAVSPAEIEATP